MTCREHSPRCPTQPTTNRICRLLQLLSVEPRHSDSATGIFLSTSCRKWRSGRLGMPAGMRDGADSPLAANPFFLGSTVMPLSESLLQR